MSEKNRQHYVPKFYLRNFSDSKKFIESYNISNSKYIPNASIKDMCQKHNFYGADNEMENYLDKNIENKASLIIRQILDTNEMPTWSNRTEDFIHLVGFLLVTEARNLKIADSANNAADYLAKSILKEHPNFKGMDLDQYKIIAKGAANFSIKVALDSVPLVSDLEPLLIVEQTGARKFITSDNPIIRYNSFYLSRNYPGGYSYFSRGLQFFFPISPTKCVLLYDSLAYDIPEAKNGVLTLRKGRDVDQLNDFFYLNAYNNVFFNQKTKRDYIEQLHKKNKKIPKINELEREINSYKSVNSKNELIHLRPNKVFKKFSFPWIKNSKFANGLKLPTHMGGIHRVESSFIREELEKKDAE